jgi:hypothetical protein
MAPRKTAAQKAAEAEQVEAPEQDKDKQLSTVRDDKSGKLLTIQQLKNKLRNEAEREVLDKHKSEVVTITAAKYKEHGLEYVRRLSDKEKAAKQIEELYAQYPELRPQLEQQQAQAEQPAVTTRAQREQFDELTVEADQDHEGYADYPRVYDDGAPFSDEHGDQ